MTEPKQRLFRGREFEAGRADRSGEEGKAVVGLAGNISQCGSVPLIDFDEYEREFSKLRDAAPVKYPQAWVKLREAERRITLFIWFTTVAPETGRMPQAVADFLVAYLFSFEAAVQVLLYGMDKAGSPAKTSKKGWFETWLKSCGRYTLTMKGLRTTRNVAAHVMAVRSTVRAGLPASSPMVGGIQSAAIPGWLFPPIDPTLLLPHGDKLKTDLGAWNTKVAATTAIEIMGEGVRDLARVIQVAP